MTVGPACRSMSHGCVPAMAVDWVLRMWPLIRTIASICSPLSRPVPDSTSTAHSVQPIPLGPMIRSPVVA
ncbi:MAG: hypothetical protein QOE54_6599 [Streptosporangiaceae bacterium]|nr:hypothetical protein [Streptosporangiaceae bacterium]